MTATKIRFYRFVHQGLINCDLLKNKNNSLAFTRLADKNPIKIRHYLSEVCMAPGDRDLIGQKLVFRKYVMEILTL